MKYFCDARKVTITAVPVIVAAAMSRFVWVKNSPW